MIQRGVCTRGLELITAKPKLRLTTLLVPRKSGFEQVHSASGVAAHRTCRKPRLREVRRRVTTHHDVAGSAHILGLRGRELRNLIVLSFCYLLFHL